MEQDEEALSLSDLPLEEFVAETRKAPQGDEFEFKAFAAGELEAADAGMCAADEVFFQGQILPLRPSVSSDMNSVSRSESMERFSSSGGSLGSESSSRSSSISARSSSCPKPYSSFSFFSYPSPKPHVSSLGRKIIVSPRKSTSSEVSGWGFLRLSLVKTPEIDVNDLRLRNSGSGRRVAEKKEQSWRSLGSRLRCKGSPDDVVVEPVPRPSPSSRLNHAWKITCSRRNFRWLEEQELK